MIDFRTRHGKELVKHTGLDRNQLRRMASRVPMTTERLFANPERAGRVCALLRSCIIRTRLRTCGVASVCPRIATNTTDFMTLDSLDTINPFYIVTVRENHHVFGFDIRSIAHLIAKTTTSTTTSTTSVNITNPYTGTSIDDATCAQLQHLIKKRVHDHNTKMQTMSKKNASMRRIVSVLQNIDAHGYHTDVSWIADLTLTHTKRVYFKLASLFSEHLNDQTRHEITCDANTLFLSETSRRLIRTSSLYVARDILLTHIEHLVNDGINDIAKNTGTLHVLCALASTVQSVRRALPWLL